VCLSTKNEKNRQETAQRGKTATQMHLYINNENQIENEDENDDEDD